MTASAAEPSRRMACPRHGDGLAHQLIHAQERAGLSREELAERLGWNSPTSLTNVLSGACRVGLNQLQAWVRVLGARLVVVPEDAPLVVPESALAALLDRWADRQHGDTYTAETSDGAAASAAAERLRLRQELIDELHRILEVEATQYPLPQIGRGHR